MEKTMKNECEERPLCMRCDHELIEVDAGLTGEELGVREFNCPYCGTIEIFYPCPEEDRENYAYYNDENEDTLGGCDHGYPGLCPQCGSHIIWGSDFMRSEVLGDVDEDDVDEYGIPNDDALASSVHCPHCGASIDVIDAKPSEYHLYPLYKNCENTEEDDSTT